MKVLTFTTLYPSAARPRHGIFVENRLLQLQRCSDVQVEVIAPVPWFPSNAACFAQYASFAKTPRRELRGGNWVHHPRYMMIPRLGMYVQPFTLAYAGVREVRLLQKDGFDCDLVDAHYCYPDGVAGAILARRIRKPLVITARGTDVNVLLDFALPRRLILWACKQAQAIITVSCSLRDRLIAHGVDRRRIDVLRNGVDLELFQPMPREASRALLGLPGGRVMISVGNLVPEKGHDIALDALANLPDMHLAIVGEGPERGKLERLAERKNVSKRVSFLANRPQSELKWVYSAADVLVLPSSREGWPNVLLEAMACGTPVAATDVGGVREIVTEPCAGRVSIARNGEALAHCVRDILTGDHSRESTRRFAERFGWTATCDGQMRVFEGAVAGFNARPEA